MPKPRHSEMRYLVVQNQGGREDQQDVGLCLHSDDSKTALLVVSDGVGGKSGGRWASHRVAELATELWSARRGVLPEPLAELGDFCRLAHTHISAAGSSVHVSPRATVVALYLTPAHAYWAYSGDSRLYHFRSRQIVEKTEDHSIVQLLVNQGMIGEHEMGSHPDQGTLLQSLGGNEFKMPTQGNCDVTDEDAFLLCTDGFWERTTVDEIAELLFRGRAQAQKRLNDAVQRAVKRNGPQGDNVTVAVALPVSDDPFPPTRKRFLLPGWLIGLAALTTCFIVVWIAFGKLNRQRVSFPKKSPPPEIMESVLSPTPETGKIRAESGAKRENGADNIDDFNVQSVRLDDIH